MIVDNITLSYYLLIASRTFMEASKLPENEPAKEELEKQAGDAMALSISAQNMKLKIYNDVIVRRVSPQELIEHVEQRKLKGN